MREIHEAAPMQPQKTAPLKPRPRSTAQPVSARSGFDGLRATRQREARGWGGGSLVKRGGGADGRGRRPARHDNRIHRPWPALCARVSPDVSRVRRRSQSSSRRISETGSAHLCSTARSGRVAAGDQPPRVRRGRNAYPGAAPTRTADRAANHRRIGRHRRRPTRRHPTQLRNGTPTNQRAAATRAAAAAERKP